MIDNLIELKDQMKYLVLYIFLLASVTACKQDNLKIPDTGRKIVINGFITTDSLLSVAISKSAFINYNSLYADTILKPLNNAKVCVYPDNTGIDSLFNTKQNQTWFHFGNYKSKSIFPVPGKFYKIEAKSPGLPDATGTTTIPNPVRIEHIDSSRFISSDPNIPWNLNMKFNIEFTDPANETNYYLFNIWKTPNTNNYNNLTFNCNDPIVEERLDYLSTHNYVVTNTNWPFLGIAFTDKIINGEKYSLTVTVLGTDIGKPFYNNGDIPNAHKKTLYFRLYSITEECYRYIHTLNLYNQNYGNPMANSVTVYSNINGGYGIFTGASVSTDSIVFKY